MSIINKRLRQIENKLKLVGVYVPAKTDNVREYVKDFIREGYTIVYDNGCILLYK